jgi:hypothetical protein
MEGSGNGIGRRWKACVDCELEVMGLSGGKLSALRVSSEVPALEGPRISIGIPEGEPEGESPLFWIMDRRVGMSMTDPVGVLGLEELRRKGKGMGDEGRLREVTPVNCLPAALE